MTDVAFNETVAATYDADSQEMFEPQLLAQTVDFLAGLAGESPALEFGIGTGRVAIPLSRRGVWVAGIDISEPMVAQMHAKPGGEAIPVTIGDIATTRAPGVFGLVYLPFNLITNLTTQDEQVACFRNAAEHLEPGGYMVAEIFVPQLQRLPAGETYQPFQVTPSHLGFDEFDLLNQVVTSHHYFIEDGRARYFASRHRFAYPAEYDLMARMTGLTLKERWADWARSEFTAGSASHISVWVKG